MNTLLSPAALELSESEIERYSRQFLLRGWSGKMQNSLKRTWFDLPPELPTLSLYLAAAGAGALSFSSTPSPSLVARLQHLSPSTELKTHSPLSDIRPRQVRVYRELDSSESTASDCFHLVGNRLIWLRPDAERQEFLLPLNGNVSEFFLGSAIATILLSQVFSENFHLVMGV